MNNSFGIASLQRMNHGKEFRAYTLRDSGGTTSIDPILGVDHAWVSAPTFPPHPHAGFSAVSYLFLDSETGIANRDSLGNQNIILPGGLHWTAAGRGVVHEEVPDVTGKTVHMLQIFVNLPKVKQNHAPFALSLAPQDIPVVHMPGVKIRVPVGNFGEARSPLTPPTDITLLDIDIEEGAMLELPKRPEESTFVLPVFGSIAINGLVFHNDELRLPVFTTQSGVTTVSLESRQGKAKVVVFSGPPLRQPVYWQGPMALASPEALTTAVESYLKGQFGTL